MVFPAVKTCACVTLLLFLPVLLTWLVARFDSRPKLEDQVSVLDLRERNFISGFPMAFTTVSS